MDNQVDYVRNTFIKKHVNGYIKKDIEELLSISKVGKEDGGGCNFPIALYVISLMDFLGYLVSTRDQPIKGQSLLKEAWKHDPERVIDYIEYFNQNDKREVLEHSGILVDVFRNGLAHQFFPKRAGVSRVNSRLFTRNRDSNYLVLDADVLAKMFLSSLENLTTRSTKEDDFCLKLYRRLKDFDENSRVVEKSASTSNYNFLSSGASLSVLPLSKGDTGISGID